MKLVGFIGFLMMALSVYAGGASLHFEAANQEALLNGARWSKSELNVVFDRQTGPLELRPDEKLLRDSLKSAVEVWNESRAGSPKFRILDISKTARTQIDVQIRFAEGETDIALFADHDSDAAAFTRLFASSRGVITRATIILNPYNLPEDSSEESLARILAHELGHALGLGHSKSFSSLMFAHAASTSRNGFRGGLLTEDDRSGIRSLYGAGDECCVRVIGKLESPAISDFSGFQVVVESLDDSRLLAVREVSAIGDFEVGGLLERNLGLRILSPDSVLVGALDSILLDKSDSPSAVFEVGTIPVTQRSLERRAFLGIQDTLSTSSIESRGEGTMEFNLGLERNGTGSQILFGHFGGIFTNLTPEIVFDSTQWAVWRIIAESDGGLPTGEFSLYIEVDGHSVMVPGALRVRNQTAPESQK
jgi:predicted Zn-dependent protease